MYVLDTNICIHVLKHRDRRLLHKFRAIRHLGVSTVTLGELNYGIENGSASFRQHRYEQLRLFTSQLAVLPWDEDAAQHYGVIRAGWHGRFRFKAPPRSTMALPADVAVGSIQSADRHALHHCWWPRWLPSRNWVVVT